MFFAVPRERTHFPEIRTDRNCFIHYVLLHCLRQPLPCFSQSRNVVDLAKVVFEPLVIVFPLGIVLRETIPRVTGVVWVVWIATNFTTATDNGCIGVIAIGGRDPKPWRSAQRIQVSSDIVLVQHHETCRKLEWKKGMSF